MARKKPTVHQRYAATNARVGNALASFEQAVQNLDEAANDHADLVNELADQINELTLLQAKADKAYEDNIRVADKIRGLIS